MRRLVIAQAIVASCAALVVGTAAQTPESRTRVFVSDEGTAVGRVLAFDVDPLTGALATNDFLRLEAAARDDEGNITVRLSGINTLAIAPDGRDLYATVDQGLLVWNSEELRPNAGVTHIELPTILAGLTHGLAFSPDSRLLYVATSEGLAIINVPDRREVKELSDLPAPYFSLSANRPIGELQRRRQVLRAVLKNGITAIRVSPDGRTLFVATGGGSKGTERSAIVQVNVDLYSDEAPNVSGLQSNVSSYLTVREPTMVMPDTGFAFRTNDTPKDLAIGRDGRRAYLLHGGATYSTQTPAEPEMWSLIFQNVSTWGLSLNQIPLSGPVVDLANRTRAELEAGLSEGFVLVNSPGTLGVFDLSPNAGGGQPNDIFLAATLLGSRRPAVRSSETVYAKRPFAIAMRPDVPGRTGQAQRPRALVAFFHSGNFGVLDMEKQELWSRSPEPPAGAFKGYIGRTPSIPFDTHVWPVQPEDVARLFPSFIQYAQNGRFAVAVHTGSSGHAICATDKFADVCRPRGSISIIDDYAISDDLDTNAHASIQLGQQTTSYYSVNPICRQHLDTRCVQDVVNPIREFGQLKIPFVNPHTAAIQPFVVFEAPRFGDHVNATTAIHVRWRDSRVTTWRLDLLDPAANDDVVSTLTGDLSGADRRSAEERAAKAVKREFHRFFSGSEPVARKAYKIRATLKIDSQELSRTDIVVTFEK